MLNRRSFLKSISLAIAAPYIPTMALPNSAPVKIGTMTLMQELWPQTIFECMLENMALSSFISDAKPLIRIEAT